MKTNKQYQEDELLFSKIYGSGVYTVDHEAIPYPLQRDRYVSVLVNTITRERFFAKCVDCSDYWEELLQSDVLKPACKDKMLWPCDLVELTGNSASRRICPEFADEMYTDSVIPNEERSRNSALLFACKDYPEMISLLQYINSYPAFNYQIPEARELVIEIAGCIDQFNREGYLFQEFHPSKIYIDRNHKIFFDFSLLSFRHYGSWSRIAPYRVDQNNYPLEFSDPYVSNSEGHLPDGQSQNYSLAAMFFYLLLGRFAYDGRLLSGYTDADRSNHYVKFRDYIKMPVFIFDPNSEENRLGSFVEEEAVTELWKNLPDPLKKMFINTLKQSNANRNNGAVANPAAGDWLKCFTQLGWNQERRK